MLEALFIKKNFFTGFPTLDFYWFVFKFIYSSFLSIWLNHRVNFSLPWEIIFLVLEFLSPEAFHVSAEIFHALKKCCFTSWTIIQNPLKNICLLVSTSVSFQGQTWLISLLSKNIFHFLGSLSNNFLYSMLNCRNSEFIFFLRWALLSLFYQVVFFTGLN